MREINIVGMGPSALSLEGKKLNGEVWGINYAYLYTPLDRLFVLHDWDVFMVDSQKEDRRSDNWLTAYQEDRIKEFWTYKPVEVACPIEQYPPAKDQDIELTYSQHKDGIKNAEELGLQSIFKSKVINTKGIVRKTQVHHFTCSLCYVIGQAIIEKVDRINLFGIEIWEYGGKNQYGGQISAVNNMLRVASGNEIQVMMPWVEAMKITDKLFYKGEEYHGNW